MTAVAGLVLHASGILVNSANINVPIVLQTLGGLTVVIGSGVNVAAGFLGLVMWLVILIGAIRMKNLESYSFAMTAAIIALIPCISPCCVLGLPFGIWARWC